ncbi:Monogalactosyldiacylglycerol synthase [Trichlorobacter thiogenes]|uniref:Monogalactosyldiacylglycerol synthase n=1 Tax=Trichlorobacter thiogenes TaxID=115783 RepID=A0A1T4KAR5_9BACT|nr:glycosyltransferase [Trichlorobacter thiogenes]SJZ39476.1 Monogalactosyldiacylglycerol synthase [Trichlorobacter thiogenes]
MSSQTPAKKKLVIFSVSAGAGHVRAAQALVAAAKQSYPAVEAVHVDLMELVPQLFRKVYADSYLKVVERHPALWGYLYDKSDHEKADSGLNKLRRAIERLNTRKLGSLLREMQPDYVICTHFLPAELLSRKIRAGKFNAPVWVQVTDFDFHALWIQQQMSGYFAAHDEVAWRMAERGIPADTIHVTGIPIMPAFDRQYDRATCAAEFGLDPNRTTLLMMSGGMGVGGIEQLAERLLHLKGDFQIVALAGRNEKLLTDLKVVAMQHPGRLFPLGFINVIERVMAASDLAITKPGGLTTSECLAVGLPMIVVSPIPGQEERNADFLLENGAALKACDAGALAWRVQHLLDNPKRLDSLRRNALNCGRPDAARRVLATVLGEAPQP